MSGMLEYQQLVDQMAALIDLGTLTRAEAELWASLSGYRLAMYDEPGGNEWVHKAVEAAPGRWQLVRMPMDPVVLRRRAEERMAAGADPGE